MKSILKAGIFAAGLLAALFQVGCASSSKDLTPSQKTGAGYSPAVLFQVSVTGNAKDYDAEEIAEKVKENLQLSGGFTFADQNRVSEICENIVEKLSKKASRKNVTDAIFGKKSVLDAITFDAYEGIDTKDMFAALKKELKCKYFVKVQVTAGVAKYRKTDDFQDPVKPVAETIVYVYDKNNELEKEIHAMAAAPKMDLAKVQDKTEITELFPDLIEKSIKLASENMNHKDKLFEIKFLKPETLELVRNDKDPISIFKFE